MTNQQAKLCRIIQKYKTQTRILQKTKRKDFGEIEEILGQYILDFTNSNDGTDIVVELPPEAIVELENRQQNMTTRVISICALIISLIDLFRK